MPDFKEFQGKKIENCAGAQYKNKKRRLMGWRGVEGTIAEEMEKSRGRMAGTVSRKRSSGTRQLGKSSSVSTYVRFSLWQYECRSSCDVMDALCQIKTITTIDTSSFLNIIPSFGVKMAS